MGRPSIAAAVLVALLLAPGPANAQPTSAETALAETLYKQGRELMAEGKYAEACPKFAESYRLDPVTGTLLNLATCHETQGRLATAWSEFNDAISAARRDGREDRVRYAQEHLAAIEPKLSRLTITVAPDADLEGLEITLNGSSIGRAALGVATPLDPGEHVITAGAPGKKEWSVTVKLETPGESKMVAVPALERAPVPVVQPGPVLTSPPPLGPPPAADVRMERPTPTAVYVSGVITLALAAGAAITSSMYVRDNGEKSEDSVRTLGYVNLGFYAAAAAGAAATTYLYVTRPERPAGFQASLAPWLDARSGGLTLRGSY